MGSRRFYVKFESTHANCAPAPSDLISGQNCAKMNSLALARPLRERAQISHGTFYYPYLLVYQIWLDSENFYFLTSSTIEAKTLEAIR